LKGGVLGVVQFRRPGDEGRGSALPKICLKDSVRIVEVAHDQIELCEIRRELARDLGMRSEKSGQRSGVQGADVMGVEAFIGERDDVGDAQDFKTRGREAIAQQSERGQRQDEIANGAAADDEDPVQLNSG
jgi:hypothetical protein